MPQDPYEGWAQRPPASDNVPLTGPWQTDPQLQQLMQAFLGVWRSQPTNRGSAGGTAIQGPALALQRYVDANRQRLGIPDNYSPDPRTGGRTLYDPNQNSLRDIVLYGGTMAAGGYGLGSALGGAGTAATAAAGTSVPASEGGAAIVGNTAPWIAAGGPAANAIPAVAAPAGATALGGVTAATPAATSIGGKLKDAFTDPGNLASIIPALAAASAGGFGGGGSNAGGVDTGRLDQLLGMAADRAQRTDPLHQMVTRLAESRMPISSRKG
jgi:hypothetical protein